MNFATIYPQPNLGRSITIFLYLLYAIIAWGSTYKSNIKILQTKQNHIARVIFFSTLYGENTESALPLLNLLDILTINNVYELQTIKFLHDWHNQHLPPIFDNCFKYAKDVHSYSTHYAANDNLYKARFRTNSGKQTLSVMATNIWKKLPPELKQEKRNMFNKRAKSYLLLKQNRTLDMNY